MNFEIVPSLRNPGGYACEAIDYDSDGAATIIEFFAGNSQALAQEYADWKNPPLRRSAQSQPAASTSMNSGRTHV